MTEERTLEESDWMQAVNTLVTTDRGRLLFLDIEGENPEFQTDSLLKRNYGLAQLARDVIAPAFTVVVPQKAISREQLTLEYAKWGLADDATWFYGCVLPRQLMNRATKIQVHTPLPGDRLPEWFDLAFPEKLKEVVLPGYSCFTVEKLREATLALLQEFVEVRLKNPVAASGEDQVVVSTEPELDAFLQEKKAAYETETDGGFAAHVREYGYVVEANLRDVAAWSYTQTTTPDEIFTSIGRSVYSPAEQPDGSLLMEYGGSSVLTVRCRDGEFCPTDLPERIAVQDPLRTGADQLFVGRDDAVIAAAQSYIDVMEGWKRDGIWRTRANVDVLKGTLVRRDGTEEAVTVAVEDSGRAGGASPAELLAARRLVADPDLHYALYHTRHVFDCEQCAVYRRHVAATGSGTVFWDGIDPSWDEKYVLFCVF